MDDLFFDEGWRWFRRRFAAASSLLVLVIIYLDPFGVRETIATWIYQRELARVTAVLHHFFSTYYANLPQYQPTPLPTLGGR